MAPSRPRDRPLGRIEKKLTQIVRLKFQLLFGDAEDAGQQGLERIDVATDRGVIDPKEEAEKRVGGVSAIIDQEHEQAVGQCENVFGSGPRLALALGSVLPFSVGRVVAGLKFGQELVEHRGCNPRQTAKVRR